MPEIREDFARCVLRHPDGRWLYHLPTTLKWNAPSALADGQPMTRIAEKSPWWSADHEATRITLVTANRPKPTGYFLRDTDALSVRYPAELTVEEWTDRIAGASDGEEEALYRLYRVETADQDPTETHIDGPFVVLDGTEPPAPGGPDWTVNLVDAITQRPEYRHLFPGYLSGLVEHVYKKINTMRYVRYCFNGFQGVPGIHVTLEVPFEQPVTRWQANLGRKLQELKSGRNVPVTVTRKLILPVPNRVSGLTHAAALAEWDRQVERWTGLIAEASVAACNHCHGTGHIPVGAEQYEGQR